MNLGQKIRLLCRLRSLISLYLKCSCQKWRSYRYRSRYYFCNFRHRKRPLLVQWTKSDLCKFFCMKFWSSGPMVFRASNTINSALRSLCLHTSLTNCFPHCYILLNATINVVHSANIYSKVFL